MQEVPMNNPQLRSFFVEHPHVAAVNQFFGWFRGRNPGLYDAIKMARPELTSGDQVVAAGLLNAKPKSRKAAKGLGAYVAEDQQTEWAQQMLDTINKILPQYFAQQKDKALLEANLHQAELGLPPITSTGYVPPASTNPMLLLGGLALLVIATKGRR